VRQVHGAHEPDEVKPLATEVDRRLREPFVDGHELDRVERHLV
jgi:hypothetical protein